MPVSPSSPPVQASKTKTDEPEHDPEGDGQQREVDPAPAGHEERHDGAQKARPERPTSERESPPVPHFWAMPEEVASQTEERPVAEGRQARVAQQQVVAQGEDRPIMTSVPR